VPDGGTAARSPASRAAGVAVLGAAVAALSYLLAVRTGAGQVWEDVVFEGRKATALWFRRGLVGASRVLTPVALVGGTAAIAVLAGRRRRWCLAAATVVAVGGAGLTATVAKDALARPVLDIPEWAGLHNRWPSGHVAVATALVLCAVTASPPRWRVRATAAGAVALGLQALAIVGSGWHRPADVVGGLGIGLAWTAAAVAVTAAARGVAAPHGPAVDPGPEPAPARGPDPWAIAAVTALASVVVLLVVRNRPTDPRHDFWAYLPTAGACVALAAATVAAWGALLGGAEVDPPRRSGVSRPSPPGARRPAPTGTPGS
jgi:hypothetical protein